MITIELSSKEMLAEIYTRVGYISGKNATSSADFFRTNACEADSALLTQLIKTALAVLAHELGSRCPDVSLHSEIMTISILPSITFSLNESRKYSVTILLREYLVASVIAGWLKVTDINLPTPQNIDIQFILDKIKAILSLGPGLINRRMTPI